MSDWPVHATIDGPIVMIGFGSIGRGTLPLIERHFDFDLSRFVVIDPVDDDRKLLDARGIRYIKAEVTAENYRDLLTPLLTAGGGRGFCVNLSVDVSSVAMMELCRELGCLYVDTVIEPWKGFYFDETLGPAARTNYALREGLLDARRRSPGGPTAVSTCGANPGMVSWFVKQALLNIAKDTGLDLPEPTTRAQWAQLAQALGVKGIHIAERDTQRAKSIPSPARSSSTRGPSRASSRRACSRPNSAGAPMSAGIAAENGRTHEGGLRLRDLPACSRAPTRASAPGRRPREPAVRVPRHAQRIHLDRRLPDGARQRGPAGLPADLPLRLPPLQRCRSVHARDVRRRRAHAASRTGTSSTRTRSSTACDELGVLLYGHARNAYWFGSQLSIEEDPPCWRPTRTPPACR